jgi:hypothetical protein
VRKLHTLASQCEAARRVRSAADPGFPGYRSELSVPWPRGLATQPPHQGLVPQWPRAGMMVQGVRRQEVLRRTLSLEMLERMGRELLARWRAVLLSLHRDRERLRRFVRAVQAQILTSPSIL